MRDYAALSRLGLPVLQHGDDLFVAVILRMDQWSLATRIARISAGTVVKEQPHELAIAIYRCLVERGCTSGIRGVDVCTMRQQEDNHLRLSSHHRP